LRRFDTHNISVPKTDIGEADLKYHHHPLGAVKFFAAVLTEWTRSSIKRSYIEASNK
jgi:hypothetical protein